MTAAGRAQPGVVLLAPRVVLHASTRPVIERVAEPRIAAISHPHLFGFAALTGYRSNAAMRTDGMVIALPKRARRLGQERSGNDPTDTWEGLHQGYVPQALRFRPAARRFAELVHQLLHAITDLLAHCRKEAKLRQQQKSVFACRLHASDRQRQRRRAKYVCDRFRTPPPDPVLCEQSTKTADGELRRPRRCGRNLQQCPDPRFIRHGGELEQLWIIPQQYLIELIDRAPQIRPDAFLAPRKFTNMKNRAPNTAVWPEL